MSGRKDIILLQRVIQEFLVIDQSRKLYMSKIIGRFLGLLLLGGMEVLIQVIHIFLLPLQLI